MPCTVRTERGLCVEARLPKLQIKQSSKVFKAQQRKCPPYNYIRRNGGFFKEESAAVLPACAGYPIVVALGAHGRGSGSLEASLFPV